MKTMITKKNAEALAKMDENARERERESLRRRRAWGSELREAIIVEFGTIAAAAEVVGVSRQRLSAIIVGKSLAKPSTVAAVLRTLDPPAAVALANHYAHDCLAKDFTDLIFTPMHCE